MTDPVNQPGWREEVEAAGKPPPVADVLAPVLALAKGATTDDVLGAVQAVVERCKETPKSFRVLVRDGAFKHLKTVVELQSPARLLDAVLRESAPPEERGGSRTEALVARARAMCELFHDGDGNAYADVVVKEHRETYSLRGRGFKRLLVAAHFDATEEAVPSQAIEDAIRVLEGFALRDGQQRKVFVRVGRDDEGRSYLDLGDASWRAVEISATGWRIVAQPAVRFVRPRGMRELPEPVRGGDVNLLFESIPIVATQPLPEDAPTTLRLVFVSATDQLLILAWLVATLLARFPYAILALTGRQGSGKSTTARALRMLIDPVKAALRGPPRDERDLVIAANASGLVAFDNISSLSERLSDALCRMATGAGFSTRELYTDGDEFLFEGARPILMTGITRFVQRADLLDRSVVLASPRLGTDRVTEDDFYATLAIVHGRILGALLDLAARTLASLPEARRVMGRSDLRMADFARVGTAVDLARGGTGRTFLNRYKSVVDGTAAEALRNDEVGLRVLDLMGDLTEWVGTASDLLAKLRAGRGRSDALLPHTPRGLTATLDRLASNLEREGVTFERGPRGDDRLLRLGRTAPQEA